MWLSSRTRWVSPARYASVATQSYQVVDMAGARDFGMATWSHTAT